MATKTEHGGTKERFVLTDGNWSTTYWTGTGKDRNDRFHETGMKTEDILWMKGGKGTEISYGNSFVQNSGSAVSREVCPAACRPILRRSEMTKTVPGSSLERGHSVTANL